MATRVAVAALAFQTRVVTGAAPIRPTPGVGEEGDTATGSARPMAPMVRPTSSIVVVAAPELRPVRP